MYFGSRFVSVLILYVVIGTVTMKFVKKKEGIEVIPNVTFWRVIPVLVKVSICKYIWCFVPYHLLHVCILFRKELQVKIS